MQEGPGEQRELIGFGKVTKNVEIVNQFGALLWKDCVTYKTAMYL
jgi:hypothetical protein